MCTSVSYETPMGRSGSSHDKHRTLDGVTQSLCTGESLRRLFTFEVLRDDPHSGCMHMHASRALGSLSFDSTSFCFFVSRIGQRTLLVCCL